MGSISSVLAQANPAATTNTDVYTVPNGYTAVITGFTLTTTSTITNREAHLAIRPDGETLATKHYVLYRYTVRLGDQHLYTVNWPLGSGDVVTLYADASDVALTLFGTEEAV